MSRIFALLALVAIASAFQPARLSRSSRTVTMMSEKSKSLPFMPQPPNLVGMPGDFGFDPVGFSNWIPAKWLREAELKHARICMLAIVGFIATDLGIHLPGDVHDVASAAAHDVAVKNGAMGQILLWTSAFELISTKAVFQMMEGKSDRAPGDFGFDPLKYSAGKSDAVKNDLALKELQNGRLAMVAISGAVTQAVLTGNGFPYMN